VFSNPSGNGRAALVGIAGATAAFFVFRGGGGGTPTDPAAAVPKDSFLVATVDLAELRRSPIHEVIVGKEGLSAARGLSGRTLPMKDLTEACGFDPLSRVERLALAVPEEGDRGELGVAARVNVTRDEIARCTTALADQRGGAVETHDVGGFIVAETRAEGPAQPRLAYGRGGLLVVGRGAWFGAMLDAALRVKPGLVEAHEHAAMRASLMSREGWRSPTVLVTAILPRTLRDRLKNDMAGEIDGKDGSNAIMAGVLGVSTVGAALKAGPPRGQIDVAVELECDTAEGCTSVERLLSRKRLEWSKELTLRMVGLGPLLDSVEIHREDKQTKGARIRLTAAAGADTLAATLDRVLRLRARTPDPLPSPREPAAETPGAAAQRPSPDETLGASRADGASGTSSPKNGPEERDRRGPKDSGHP
jgi:hypothetical protein